MIARATVCVFTLALFALYISALSHLWMAVFLSFCVSCVFFLLGFWINPRVEFEREFSVFTSLQNAPATLDHLVLFGCDLRQQPRVRCRFSVRNLPLLVAALCISFGGALGLWLSGISLRASTNRMNEDDSALLLFVWIASLVPLVVASQWLVERASVTKDDVIAGFVNRKTTEIGYEFQDEDGNYFGNTEPQRQPIGTDNVVLVFLLRQMPSFNRAHCGLRYHLVSPVAHKH